MGLKAPTFSGLNAKTINVGTLESSNETSVQVVLGDDAGDDFIVDTSKLVVEGDTGRIGIGTATPASSLEMESSSGDLILEMDNNASNSANFQIQNGAGNARVDCVMNDGSANTTLTMKGQKVGIMDTNPSHTLDVTGNANISTDLVVGGDVDVDGTLEADAITVDGVTLAETIADTVGAMVGSNTETGITVTYQDADNTLDFELAAVGTNGIADDAVTLDKMAGLVRGKIIVGDASGNPSALAAGADGKLLVADANGDPSWTTVSGDIGLSAGAMTIQTGAVEHAMLAGDAVDGDNIADDSINSEHYVDGSIDEAHIADNQVTLAKMAGIARGKIIVGDSSGNPSVLALGSDTYVLTSDGSDVVWAAAAGGAAADDSNTILHMQVFA